MVFGMILLILIALVLLRARAVSRLTKSTGGAMIVITSEGSAALLEQRVRAFYAEQQFCAPGCACDIVILTDETTEQLARELSSELTGVYAVRAEEIGEFILDKTLKYKNQDSYI